MSEVIPITCFLTDIELQTRRRTHLDEAAASLIVSTELQVAFRFPLDR